MKATARPIRTLSPQQYQCSRCGAIRTCKSARQRPELCADCRSVLAYREPDPPKPKPVLPDFPHEERLAGHRAYEWGLRDEETVARNRAYERARYRDRKAS